MYRVPVPILVLALLVGAAGCGELGNDHNGNNRRQAQSGRHEDQRQDPGGPGSKKQSGGERAGEERQSSSPSKHASGEPPTKRQLRVPGLRPQPAYDPEGCALVRRVVVVRLDRSEYPRTVAHTKAAVRRGEPRLLHIDRRGADENREQSLAGIPTRDGFDRDEMPPAVSFEGGPGADVAYVPSSDNRGAGASMGAQLADYCSGQAFRFAFVP